LRAPAVAVDMRYAGARNFVGRPVRGYGAARCWLTRPAAAALARAARDLAPAGLGLMVYDCYRPQRAVDDFVAWAAQPGDAPTRPAHYPAVAKAELFARGYIAARSGHSRGSTVDVTLVRLPFLRGASAAAPAAATDCRLPAGATTAPDGSVDMGTTFDCFDERSHTDAPGISPAARANRRRLRTAMERQGFVNLAQEWWHFTLVAEPFPDTVFDVEIRPGPPP
jgi:D-alanyl-D-alanine dipeptidase